MSDDDLIKLQGWGGVNKIISKPLNISDLPDNENHFIPTGNFRSYGDAALSKFHIPMLPQNRFISFDDSNGLLVCEAGVLLSEIIEIFFSKGWFLSISPGTKFITVGGAVASDVHGKNHHIAGCFSECVKSFNLLLPDNQLIQCSRTENKDLFYATCGGMGLTGIIKEVSFYLKRVNSKWIKCTNIKNSNLSETFESFEHYKSSSYSVAWLDCMAEKRNIGRSILSVGDFCDDGDVSYKQRKNFNIPFYFPSFFLNKLSVNAFNKLYYSNVNDKNLNEKIDIDSFFYPLDKITNWNRIYGKRGFIQYQFILPFSVSFEGLDKILNIISQSGMGSFLAVLKKYGVQNNNWLSFPMEGYSLALDFKMQRGLQKLIHELTDIVIQLGGRVYLAKDTFLSRDQFDKSYPNANIFRSLRKDMGLNLHIQSLLSERLMM